MTVSLRRLPPGHSGLVSARTEPDLVARGYEEVELLAAGEATSYTSTPWRLDGRIEASTSQRAPFTTRVIVRRPRDAAAASGTLVVEWLNVSSGNDAAPGWTDLGEELLRSGHAWAGVSAQYVGVEGGPESVHVAERPRSGLRRRSRYADVRHPGDAFAFDLFGQVAGALRLDVDLGRGIDTLLAHGQSQSAVCLTTYVDAVHPVAPVFDGFLLHSRGGVAAPLDAVGEGLRMDRVLAQAPVRIRDDLDVPVLVVQTEGDLFDRIGFLPARQPDSARVRTWEIAGSAHLDRYLMGEHEDILGCTVPINAGQQAFVLRAGLRHLDRWARGGAPAPSAAPLEVDPELGDRFVLDDAGNVRGGVRTPAVVAAVEVLSGRPWPGAGDACRLAGSTVRVPDVGFASREAYLEAYTAAFDDAVAAGFLLDDDRAEVLADRRWRDAAGVPTL